MRGNCFEAASFFVKKNYETFFLEKRVLNRHRLGYKFYFYKRSNHEESFSAVKINHKNLDK